MTSLKDKPEGLNPQDITGYQMDRGKKSLVLVNGEVLEHWPQDLFIPPNALEVFLEAFQGPLDLLLYLIRKQNLDILDIPVALITRQYMEYVELMRRLRLDLAADYLVMAATLTEIKSRMLLPRPAAEDEEEQEDPRAALIRQLQEYERFSAAGVEIDKLPRIERELFLICADFNDDKPVKAQAQASLKDLAAAFGNVLERADLNQRLAIEQEGLTVREKMTHILNQVNHKRFLYFEDLFNSEEGKAGMITSFIALLELIRDQMLIAIQNEPFTPVYIKANFCENSVR